MGNNKKCASYSGLPPHANGIQTLTRGRLKVPRDLHLIRVREEPALRLIGQILLRVHFRVAARRSARRNPTSAPCLAAAVSGLAIQRYRLDPRSSRLAASASSADTSVAERGVENHVRHGGLGFPEAGKQGREEREHEQE